MMTVAQDGFCANRRVFVMRWFVAVTLVLVGSVSQAEAQAFDTPTLRGSSPFIPAPAKYSRWDGLYGGGQVGWAFANMDFRDAFGSVNIFNPGYPLTAPLGQVNWAAAGQKNVHAVSYGAFLGYNTQFEDAVIGAEVNYNHTSLSGRWDSTRCYSATDPNCLGAITLGDSNQYNVNVTATASARITDYGTLRARGGWAAGAFMPYAMAGVALARVEVAQTATASATPVTTGTAFVHTERELRTRVSWGYSLGGGVDYMVTRDLFVRGEYEYIQLNPVAGVKLNINTARFGAGLRF